MDTIINILKATDLLIGLMIALIGAVTGTLVWWDRRSRRYVDGRTADITSTNVQVTKRLSALEADVRRLEGDVTEIKTTVSQLPTSREFSELKSEISGMRALQAQQNGMLQTLYEAALRASIRDPGK